MRRPHSRIFVRRFDDCSHARWTPPSCATESSPYSPKTRVVQLLRASQPDGRVDGQVAGEVEVADELGRGRGAAGSATPRVPREQRALHHLGQVHEREHRPVEVREVRAERRLLLGGEVLRDVLHGGPMVPTAPAPPADQGRGLLGGRSDQQHQGLRGDVHRDRGPGREGPGVDLERLRALEPGRERRPPRWTIWGWGTWSPVGRRRRIARRVVAPERVHLHLEAAVAGVAPRDDVEPAQELTVRHDDGRRVAVEDGSAVDGHRAVAASMPGSQTIRRRSRARPCSRPGPTCRRGPGRRPARPREARSAPAGTSARPTARARSDAGPATNRTRAPGLVRTAAARSPSSPRTSRSGGPAAGRPHGSPFAITPARRRDDRRCAGRSRGECAGGRHDAAYAGLGALVGPSPGDRVGGDVARSGAAGRRTA